MAQSLRSRSPSVSVDADYAEGKRQGTTPSQRLLVAVMRRAIWDFVLYQDEKPKSHKNREDRKKSEERLAVSEEAGDWLFWDGEERDEEGRYSFIEICEMLDLDPSSVRKRVIAMSREDIQRLNNHIKDD